MTVAQALTLPCQIKHELNVLLVIASAVAAGAPVSRNPEVPLD